MYPRREGKAIFKAYLVLADMVLQAIAAARPTTADELAKVWGMGPSKMRSYGEELLEPVLSFRPK
jgi:superfamily II DNA helicase RecQ